MEWKPPSQPLQEGIALNKRVHDAIKIQHDVDDDDATDGADDDDDDDDDATDGADEDVVWCQSRE